MKRVGNLMLAIILVLGIFQGAYAAEESAMYEGYAQELSKIGVFRGTDQGFELDRQPTRLEGLVMLLRLLGKEDEDLATGGESVFSDVPRWGIPYANYAYNAGLTKGIGDGLFGASQTIDAKSYHTFLLRALGYDDSAGDFSWCNANEFAHQNGLIDTGYYADVITNTFLRDHVAKSSYDALYFNVKNSQEKLIDILIESGDIDKIFSNPTIEKNFLEVHFLDVGQALCVLIKDNEGNQLLYDAGNNGDGDFIVSYLESVGVDDIEYLINSHPHEDHIGGMDDVLRAFDVEQVIMSSKTYDSRSYDDVVALISNQVVPVEYPDVGTEYQIGDWSFEIVGPIGGDYINTNNYSIVVKVSYGETDILLTGDAEILSELEMIAAGTDLEAEILQIGHHGSSYSTSSQLLREVDPDYAVISVGEGNSYGYPDDGIGKAVHPDPAVTDRPEN